MQLRITALTFFLAATRTVVSGCKIEEDEPLTPCYDYTDLEFDLDPASCTSKIITNKIKDMYKEMDDESDCKCKGGSKRDIRALTGNADYDGALETIVDMCTDALTQAANKAESGTWDSLEFDLDDYFEGEGFLNKETGNFQQPTDKFNGGHDSYISISDDPRNNDHYKTTEESYIAGTQVNEFYDSMSKVYLDAPTTDLGSCESKTVMCCWGRDRQYFDGNGSCKVKDCANENPGDNTDLCWTEDEEGEIYPYPGDGTENDLHCHGISWGSDEDINTKGKWNSLFYVSLYDHMYERGYVEAITDDAKIAGAHPMCGCIEEMAPVARADCQEAVGKAEYKVTAADNLLRVDHVEESFYMDFESCQGYQYLDGVGPEDYETELNLGELKATNNDLAGFVYKQWLEGKLTNAEVELVEETLIGYRRSDLDLQNKDNKREEACEDAFKEKYPGRDYKERELPEVDTDAISV